MNPQSELIRSGLWTRITVVNGALEDYAAVERAVVEHDVDSVFHLAAQAIVTTALRSPLATFESNIRGTLQSARRLPRARRPRPARRRREQRQGVRRVADAAVHGGHAARRPASVRRQQELHRSAGADLRAHISPAGHRGAVRQHLRRRRLELEPDRAGHDSQRAAQRASGDPQRRSSSSATTSTCATSSKRISRSGITSPRNAASARRSISAPKAASRCSRSRDEIQRLMERPDLEPIVLNQAKAEIPNQYLDSSQGAPRAWLVATLLARSGPPRDDRVVSGVSRGGSGLRIATSRPMQVAETSIAGVYLVTPAALVDERGHFARQWDEATVPPLRDDDAVPAVQQLVLRGRRHAARTALSGGAARRGQVSPLHQRPAVRRGCRRAAGFANLRSLARDRAVGGERDSGSTYLRASRMGS